MIVWSRPPIVGALFCAVVRVDSSVHTLCRGRWQPSELDAIRWEPPAGQRCGACWTAFAAEPVWFMRANAEARERMRAAGIVYDSRAIRREVDGTAETFGEIVAEEAAST